MFRKWMTSALVTAALLWAFTGIAEAHAVVYPKTTSANSFEKFVLRVPVEKESDTVKVRIEMPEGFAISRVKPLPGWTYQVEKSTDGKTVKAITWTGGKIAPGEFQEFEFQGKTAANPGKYSFRVWQTYADGETVAWTGPSDSQTPASVVEVTASQGGTDAHGQDKPAAGQPAANAPAQQPAATAPAQQPAPAAGSTSLLTTAAAYGGLLLGAAALLVGLRRR